MKKLIACILFFQIYEKTNCLKFGDGVGKAFQDFYASILAYNSEKIKINLKMNPEFTCH